MLITVSSFDEAKLYCKYFDKLVIPLKFLKLLNSGKVMFAFKRGFSSFSCRARFPVDSDDVVQSIVKEGDLKLSNKTKVVITVGLTKGSPNLNKMNLKSMLLNCFGLTILHLKDPKKLPDNYEDKDVMNFVKQNNISTSIN
jgi:hypothetical protein